MHRMIGLNDATRARYRGALHGGGADRRRTPGELSISVQRLSVEAAVHGDDTLLRQAMMMDPLTSAVLNPPEIWQMVDDLLIAQEQWLPRYAPAIAEAKQRVSSPDRLPTRDYEGAARLHTKSVAEMEQAREAARKNAAEVDKAMK
jgi:alpha-galactosidase